ncbi:MAG: carbon-nitrogen hydrolase family protein [Sedimentisphaerales bacterium]|nr:carbon-nitrogen hydrolase family protein [Sedimentisphaerales bacterium]
MSRLLDVTILLILGTSVSVLPCFGADAGGELVVNSRFETKAGASLPDGWSVWKPAWHAAACRAQAVAGGLLVEAAGDPYAVGGVTQDIDAVRPGRAYRVRAECELRDIASPYRSVMVRISWLKNNRLIHPAGMLVRGPVVEGRTARFSDVFVAPEGTDAARLSLEVKWPGAGAVLWKHVSLCAAPVPGPRAVKIGTVYLRPRGSTPENNLKLWCEQIDAAGKLGLDIVCLGEVITRVGTQASLQDVAQPIPGPATDRLGKAAKSNRIWVVAGLTERVGDVVYNTAVLFDRRGRIAGTYRKTHLPREEWKQGVRPGREYPVFDTDFGRVAMQICYDWFFPEPTAILALKGAEIVFAPTWGNTLPDEDGKVNGETVFRVRARDNGVFMVPSVYDGSSLVIDPMGRILASNRGKDGVFWAEVDLNRRECLRWVGHWRSVGPRDRMPGTYNPLAEPQLNPDEDKVNPTR